MQVDLFDSPGKLRRLLDDSLFQPSLTIYWLDFGCSIVVAWALFWFGLSRYSRGWFVTSLSIVAASLFFYRALFFIHEISHLKKDRVQAFRWAWNSLCGCAFFLPDFTYLIHSAHHSIHTFSTSEDPEYLPLTYQEPLEVIAPFLIFPLAPIVLMVRFLVLGPVSWFVAGRFRQWLLGYVSSLKMNPGFEWKNIRKQDRRLVVLQETGCIVWWTAFIAVGLSVAGPRLILHWYLVFYTVLTVNHIRAMVAHRYNSNSGEEVGYEDQLLDSITITGFSPVASILAPVGLRYHSLHHLFPTLPYHSLGAAHERLMEVLPPVHTYRKTLVSGVGAAFGAFFLRRREKARFPGSNGARQPLKGSCSSAD